MQILSETPVNLALGKSATASSIEYPAYPATNATDGSLTTRWSSTQQHDPEWIFVDLGAVYAVEQVVLRWEAAAESYRIEFSDDAATWVQAAYAEARNGGVDIITVSGNARFVRMFGLTRVSSGFGYSLFEFEVYGAPVYPTPVPQIGFPVPTPGANTLFFDDFDDGANGEWSFVGGTWQVTNGYLETQDPCQGSYSLALVGDGNWQDYELQYDFRAMAGAATSFAFRNTGNPYTNGYVLTHRRLADIVLEGGAYTSFVPYSFLNGTWYRIRIRVEGMRIQVYVNEQLLLDRTDTNGTNVSGAVGPFVNAGAINCPQYWWGQYDNIIVNRLVESATATPTADVTSTPSTTPTPQNSTPTLGDINADGAVNILDLQRLINMILHPLPQDTELYPLVEWEYGDLDKNAQWNVLDLQYEINLIQSR